MSAAAAPVLEVEGACKRFGAVTALSDVSLTLGRGEILALLGDNGAGKSTLIKCVSGAQRLDSGRVRVGGDEVALRSPMHARAHGIETVYQDLSLFDNLSVAANFFAGRELVAPPAAGRAGWLRNRAMTARVAETLDRLAVNVPDLQTPVGLLSGGQRQAIAVARAVDFATRVVILDEPTAALGVRETRNVLRLVKRLPEQGVSVLIISHNLEQVAEVAHRVVVLRRGSKVGEAPPDAEHHDRIVSLIVGAQADPL
ncbi:MAG: ribose transport system ATP-binding protein [Solirubrobacteraceae bacterium]|jgi:ABC-type sugar transport system ATPase subunit|nr:ribose transport system ATP-binding protein [Solirubrobacteraceae bacterium]